ncbi:MAG: hypothetical protein J6Y65_04730, partial [Eggerthellaceae bacterium]|nr:hypothetical protein [Eggerthellaceae bacterium]
DMLEALFLENNHMAGGECIPCDEDPTAKESLSLAEAFKNMTDDDKERIKIESDELRKAQETPDDPADSALIPRMSIKDLGPGKTYPQASIDTSHDRPCIRTEINTHGISYVSRIFNLNNIDADDLYAANLWVQLLREVGTSKHSKEEILASSYRYFGVLSARIINIARFKNDFDVQPYLRVWYSCMENNLSEATALAAEILADSVFETPEAKEDVLDTVKQIKLGFEISATDSGHALAAGRLASYFRPEDVLNQRLQGIEWYRYICDFEKRFDECYETFVKDLKRIVPAILNSKETLSFAGSDKAYEGFWHALESADDAYPGLFTNEPCPDKFIVPSPSDKNEAFIIPTNITFSALGAHIEGMQSQGHAAWPVISNLLSYNYLWNEIRAKGGAYGTGFSSERGTFLRFYTFRDPHVDESLATIRGAARWLLSQDISQEEIDSSIINIVAKAYDKPQTRREQIHYQIMRILGNVPKDYLLEKRSELLLTNKETVGMLARDLNKALETSKVCVIGCAGIINSATEPLQTSTLF